MSLGIENIWHIDDKGRMTHFENTFSDYGAPIEKIYRFATQFFGTYDVLKNVSYLRQYLSCTYQILSTNTAVRLCHT